MSQEVKHVGFKTVALILGWLLGAVWTILDFLVNWLNGVDMTVITNWLLGLVACIVLFPIFAYIAHILWKFAYKVEDLIG